MEGRFRKFEILRQTLAYNQRHRDNTARNSEEFLAYVSLKIQLEAGFSPLIFLSKPARISKLSSHILP